MENICNKFGTKIKMDINQLLFLYNGNKINLNSKFKEQINKIDNERNKMNILVYQKELEGLKCPKCGEIMNYDKINNWWFIFSKY